TALSRRNRRNRIPALSRGERVARSGAFISRSVTGEGSVRDQARLSAPRLPSRDTSRALIPKARKKSGNEAGMSLKTKAGKKRIPALSRGERVARSGAFISRSVTGEGSVRDQAGLLPGSYKNE